MLYDKYINTKEFENSGMTDEYEYLYNKNKELGGDNNIIEYGIDFLNCKIIHSKHM